MIKYALLCAEEHEFEGWFRDSQDFDVQANDGLIECPLCGSDDVRKAIMAPAIGRKSNHSATASAKKHANLRDEVIQAAERAREYVESNFEYVGGDFPEEARKIHYGETQERGIFGEASSRDVKELIDEGVGVAPLPGPEKKTDKAGVPKVAPSAKKTNSPSK